MLAFLVQKDRAYLISHHDRGLNDQEQKQWNSHVMRRKRGEPVAYIIGQREFYGRIFRVDRRVHIPRPSTENLVTMALDFLKDPKDGTRELETGIIGIAKVLRDCGNVHTIVDVGTGSGCIAITLALERPDLNVIGIDISSDALDVAKANAKRLGAHCKFLEGDLLSPVQGLNEPFYVVSNPPYLSVRSVQTNTSIQWEPPESLIGGESGIAVLQNLLRSAVAHKRCCGCVYECEAA